MMIISCFFAAFFSDMQVFSDSVLSGANSAIELLFSITGVICFWSGMMEIADKSGVTQFLSKIFSPILKKLFINVPGDSEAMRFISLNISANLLGLGNAATPFGLSAMRELKKLNNDETYATDDMLLFVVLNTASLQLIPTTLCAYRSSYGSKSPFEIIPCVWLVSLLALFVGIVVAKSFPSERRLCK